MNLVTENDDYFEKLGDLVESSPLGVRSADRTNSTDAFNIDAVTKDWTQKAALGQTSWVCCDCGTRFPEGMPDACQYGQARCTEIIQRDKKEALERFNGVK